MTRLEHVLALGSLVLLPVVAAAQIPAAPDEAKHYVQCLADAKTAPDKGLAEARDWRNANGGFPAEHCEAVALFAARHYAEAAAAFEALAGAMMNQKPALRAGALDQAAQGWLLAGEPKKAQAALDGALRYTPSDPDLFIDRARADADARDFASAVDDLTSALKLAPGRADALIYRASAWRQEGDLGKARADIDAALKATPNDPEGLLEQGNILNDSGDVAGARAAWAQLVKLAPASTAADAARANLSSLAK